MTQLLETKRYEMLFICVKQKPNSKQFNQLEVHYIHVAGFYVHFDFLAGGGWKSWDAFW